MQSTVTDTDLHKPKTYLEDDPHRAALEDNPEVPEPLTLMKVLAIAVSDPLPDPILADVEPIYDHASLKGNEH